MERSVNSLYYFLCNDIYRLHVSVSIDNFKSFYNRLWSTEYCGVPTYVLSTYFYYEQVLEVCDCVHLEDGRSILSTIGVSRFKVIERDVRDG